MSHLNYAPLPRLLFGRHAQQGDLTLYAFLAAGPVGYEPSSISYLAINEKGETLIVYASQVVIVRPVV